MKKFFILGLIIAAAFAFSACDTTTATVKSDDGVTAQPPAADNTVSDKDGADMAPGEGPTISYGKTGKDVVAVIGKYVLTKDKYKILVSYMEKKYGYKLTGDQEKEFIEYVVNRKLMAMEAREQGYGEKTDIKVQYEWDFDDLVSHAYYADNVDKKASVTAEAARAYYDKNKGDFTELQASHVLVKSKDLANSILKRAAAGEDFAELAKNYSVDDTTKGNGGDLGWFLKGVMVREFEEAAFAAGKGEVVGPVKTVFGWHVIKVMDKKPISFDDSKDRIMKIISDNRRAELFDRMMKGLKAKYGATVSEEYK